MGQYKSDMRRAEPGEAVCSHDGCPIAALTGSDYCPAHGGHGGHQRHLREQRRLYNIKRYQERMESLRNHPDSRTFREEIAVLRMTFEATVNSCKDDNDLIMKSSQISALVKQIESAMVSVEKLDRELGRTMTAEQAETFIDKISVVIAEHVTDPDVLAAVAADISEIFADSTSIEPEFTGE